MSRTKLTGTENVTTYACCLAPSGPTDMENKVWIHNTGNYSVPNPYPFHADPVPVRSFNASVAEQEREPHGAKTFGRSWYMKF